MVAGDDGTETDDVQVGGVFSTADKFMSIVAGEAVGRYITICNRV